MAMRKEGLCGILTIHTHPRSVEYVDFSWYDDEQDPLLMENLIDLEPATWLSSMVLGAQSQKARLWTSPRKVIPISTLVCVGESLRYLPLDRQPAPTPPAPSEIFNRGYSNDLLLKQPAVMDFNMRAASMKMIFLRHLLQPFLLTPLPLTLAENLVTYNMKPVAAARARNDGCDVCRSNPTAGFGDCAGPLGLPSDVAKSLIEED